MKKVYVALIADLLHAGHIKIIKKAADIGDVTVGLLTKHAIEEMGDKEFLSYDHRKQVLENIGLIKEIIPQEQASYRKNIVMLKPDFVVHGDDWRTGRNRKYRDEVTEILKAQGGELIEIEYSSDISDSGVFEHLKSLGVIKITRQQKLRELIRSNKLIKVLEAHNPLSALIAENVRVVRDNNTVKYDAVWSSSLTDSTAKGKPDIEAVDMTSRINVINDIFEVTTLPMIVDADTGGKTEHFEFTVKTLERTGVSAVVIEDKTGLKKNSLFGTDVTQTQDTIENFCSKIRSGKLAQRGDDFMIIARVESLILDAGMEDALKRAHAYVSAGADGVMIHSRKKQPDEIIEFMKLFRSKDNVTPIVVVPTSFNSVYLEEFEAMGVNIVIYANHMLRAAYPAMVKVAENILRSGRSLEAEPDCLSINEILEMIPGTK